MSHSGKDEARTSASHPLRIDSMPAGANGGRIGITFCPGKHDQSSEGFRWARDLSADLDAIGSWPAAALVTLLEDHEFSMMQVGDLGAQARARGMDWLHMPITDVQPPDGRFESRWAASRLLLLTHLREGRRVVVHCRGGLGRAGTVSARMLVELGMLPAQAVKQVRQARPGAIETAAQERYVLSLPHGQA